MYDEWKAPIDRWAKEIPLPERNVLVGSLVYSIGQPKEGRELYNQARTGYVRSGDRTKLAGTLQHQGIIERREGNPQGSKKLLMESLTVFEDIGFLPGIADTLAELAHIERDTGNDQEALNLYDRVRVIYKDQRDEARMAAALQSMAIIEKKRTHYAAAMTLCQEAKQVFEKLGKLLELASTLGLMAQIAQDSTPRNDDQAKKLYAQARGIFEKLQYKPGIADILHNLATIELRNDRSSVAMGLCEESLQIRKKLGDKRGVAKSLGLRALILEAMKQFQDAESDMLESHRIFTELGDKQSEAIGIHHLNRIRKKIEANRSIHDVRTKDAVI